MVILSSIGFSFALACAAPLAALATLAALKMSRRDLFTFVGAAWLANQLIGYGFLGIRRPGTASPGVVQPALPLIWQLAEPRGLQSGLPRGSSWRGTNRLLGRLCPI